MEEARARNRAAKLRKKQEFNLEYDQAQDTEYMDDLKAEVDVQNRINQVPAAQQRRS